MHPSTERPTRTLILSHSLREARHWAYESGLFAGPQEIQVVTEHRSLYGTRHMPFVFLSWDQHMNQLRDMLAYMEHYPRPGYERLWHCTNWANGVTRADMAVPPEVDQAYARYRQFSGRFSSSRPPMEDVDREESYAFLRALMAEYRRLEPPRELMIRSAPSAGTHEGGYSEAFIRYQRSIIDGDLDIHDPSPRPEPVSDYVEISTSAKRKALDGKGCPASYPCIEGGGVGPCTKEKTCP